jgi:hypothetical protein
VLGLRQDVACKHGNIHQMKHHRSFSDVVVGSGPTAYAAVSALIELDRHPVVIDFGLSPRFGSSRIERISSVASKSDGMRSRVFDYPKSLISSVDGDHLPVSSARGGLSNIWGAGILVRSENEMTKFGPVWPELDSAYKSLLKLIPHVGINDQTSKRFPWDCGGNIAPQSMRYAKAVQNMQKIDTDVLIGWPRIALKNDQNDCTRCGSCLHGCPNNLFFNSRLAIEKYALNGQCSFADGPVLSIEHLNSCVQIRTPNETISGDRVYLAAGPIGTPALIQRSGLGPKEVVVKDSAVFYCGFINRMKTNDDESEFTSSHLVAYADKPGEKDFQLAIYESNVEYISRLSSVVRLPVNLIKVPKFVVNRINAGIGFLDSSVSGNLIVRYVNGRSIVTRNQPQDLHKRARLIVRKVSNTTKRFGVHSIPNFVLVPPVGSGYHSGASLPIGGDLIEFSGNIRGNPRVFIVDATSLPEINAGSHTFTAMANAFRIVKGTA